ncbi:MAG TPA: dihydropteroate synthase, partial [Muribaculaceae bacterium]|nr:dihydropteroate synthase [Muribaculaceae bacterium]
MQPYTIKLRGRIEIIDHPWVMGILNVTNDSFYGGSRAFDEKAVATRVRKLLDEGVDVIDVGACSTRPGCECIVAEEERRRLDMGMRVLRSIDASVPVSVDTFRADIARHCVEDLGVDMLFIDEAHTLIGAGGVEKIVEFTTNDEEKAMFAKSVESVQGLIQACKDI